MGEWVAHHPTWEVRANHLVGEFATTNYARSAQLVQAQAAIAQRLNHHPELILSYGRLRVELWTHDQSGLTQLDLDYALAFDELIAVHFRDVLAD